MVRFAEEERVERGLGPSLSTDWSTVRLVRAGVNRCHHDEAFVSRVPQLVLQTLFGSFDFLTFLYLYNTTYYIIVREGKHGMAIINNYRV